MTSPLDEFHERWAAVPMPLPLFEVINTPVDLDGMPDQWAGAILQPASIRRTWDGRADVTMGSRPWVEETGEIIIGLLARSGTGRNVLDAGVTALRRYFHGWISPDFSVQFISVIGPEDIDPQADGEWWRIGLRLPYVVQSRRAAPVEFSDPLARAHPPGPLIRTD